MTDRVQLVVPGCPQPAERARQGRGRWYTPPATVEYRQRIGWVWREHGSSGFGDAPLALSARFYIARPPSHYGTGKNARIVRPSKINAQPPGDLDNYLKGLLDALQAASAFINDSQIVCLSGVSKPWATRGNARAEVDIWVARSIGLAA
jgi:Holliday junction resolvase RusA-like endonuclease